MFKWLKEALSLSTSDVLQHLDAIDKKQVQMERHLDRIEKRIDPLAELVESMRGERK
jgi:DNA transposition AAA+ family ATPase